jgi:hypothetical protein
MNKQELKKILKPLIKECIKEVIFEDGTLSSIIAEVMKGVGTEPLVEQKKTQTQPPQKRTQNNKRLQEQRKKMLDAIGKDSYNGVNIFEGVTPTQAPNSGGQQGPLSGVDPRDPGVDITKIAGSGAWKKLAGN